MEVALAFAICVSQNAKISCSTHQLIPLQK